MAIDDGREPVDPLDTIDGGDRRIDTSLLEGVQMDTTGGLGDLVQPTDDDADGVWGGEDPEPPPDGGQDPAAMEMADVEAIATEGVALDDHMGLAQTVSEEPGMASDGLPEDDAME